MIIDWLLEAMFFPKGVVVKLNFAGPVRCDQSFVAGEALISGC